MQYLMTRHDRPHPNAHLIDSCSPARRKVRRFCFCVVLVCACILKFIFNAFDRNHPAPHAVLMLALWLGIFVGTSSIVLLVSAAHSYFTLHKPFQRGRHGLIPFARFWGGAIVDKPPVELEHGLLGSVGKRRYDMVATLPPTEDGRRVFAFEMRYRCSEINDLAMQNYYSCIAVELDPTWTADLSNLTVSPSKSIFVHGKRDIRDKRWELLDLDSRFQFDAGRVSKATDVALAQLFGPQMQIALGTTFCAYWQQRGRWLLVWIPGQRTTFTSWQALWSDALWLRSRYAELGRSAQVPILVPPPGYVPRAA